MGGTLGDVYLRSVGRVIIGEFSLNFCYRRTDRRMLSDAYEPTVQGAQVGSKTKAEDVYSTFAR